MVKFTQDQVDQLNLKIKTTDEAIQWVSDNLHPKVAKHQVLVQRMQL